MPRPVSGSAIVETRGRGDPKPAMIEPERLQEPARAAGGLPVALVLIAGELRPTRVRGLRKIQPPRTSVQSKAVLPIVHAPTETPADLIEPLRRWGSVDPGTVLWLTRGMPCAVRVSGPGAFSLRRPGPSPG
jgi:hypothetical protein